MALALALAAVLCLTTTTHFAFAQNCILAVPANPLSAQGLATPYLLSGSCDQTNSDLAVFAEATILRPSTGQVFLYTPLVVNAANPTPAKAPVVPPLQAGDVVGIWFGSNADTVSFIDQQIPSGGGGGGGRRPGGGGGGGTTASGGIAAGNCIDGFSNSPRGIFGQVAFCNAVQFFAAANQAIQAGRLRVPAIGTSRTGQMCPTTRSFSVVDQDQSDNVLSSYLVVPFANTKLIAQGTATNAALFPNATEEDNGSDNRLLGDFILPALGCAVWKVTDLADPSGRTQRTSQAMNELQAAAYQQAPTALIPALDPMVLTTSGTPDLVKLNMFRAGVNQPTAANLGQADTAAYCLNYKNSGLPDILAQRQFTNVYASPDSGVGSNLFTFLAARFAATWDNLTCRQLTGIANPVVPVVNSAGVCTGARFNGQQRILS